MTQKVVVYHVHEHRGCLSGCMGGCMQIVGITLLVSTALAVMGYVTAAAAGVGAWFLLRYIWRSMVDEMPDSVLVRWGLRMAPITRKVLAALLCVAVSLLLAGAWAELGSDGAAGEAEAVAAGESRSAGSI